MCEHHWWLVLRGEDRYQRCSTCGHEEKIVGNEQFTVTLVEPAVGDQDDE